MPPEGNCLVGFKRLGLAGLQTGFFWEDRMFTGIVQGLIEVSEIEHMDDISRLRLNLAELGEGLSLGAVSYTHLRAHET